MWNVYLSKPGRRCCITIISANSISVQFGDKTLLDGLSLQVLPGEKIIISGESGCGKSTFLKTLIGMYQPVSGSVLLFDDALETDNLAAIRQKMFYLPQDILPHGEETVSEYLRYPFTLAINKGLAFPEQKLQKLIPVLNLSTELLNQPLYRLSGGERKRVGVLCGLLLQRPLMLLDEPTAGIDVRNRDTVVELLFNDTTTTIIAVSHDEAVQKQSNRTIIIGNGASGVSNGST